MIRSFSLAITVLSLLTLAPSSARAESDEGRWKLIGKSKTDTLWYIDTSTLSRPSKDIVSVWVKTVPAKTDKEFLEEEESIANILKKIQARSFGDYEYTEALWEVNCSTATFRLLYFAAYNNRDEMITSILTPAAEWSSIVDGSVAETLREAVCPE